MFAPEKLPFQKLKKRLPSIIFAGNYVTQLAGVFRSNQHFPLPFDNCLGWKFPLPGWGNHDHQGSGVPTKKPSFDT